ncbi:shikimate dehydrogenase (NADP(+)) [Lysobacter helvus]|uniref:Shikimate dehydrogenase (NADP(+)) n=2 Tax=Lysobacteraceae TaxID=32033 RepID=A0ABM7Q4E2_9GAMM|nr:MULTISPECIES: shikimate dehydrogenase [Lysobacter]BCT92140.1 shikimate dehydrogenase (NADP(+)) [Lysobacter caseinilyticus]BCT95293.1 shikimate dehydrogenase (NADP(+)) [Lysobacter helvus]
MSRHYAVFGHPVAHSLSPRIHAAFGRQTSIPIDYRAIDVEPGQFTHALMDFVASGGAGANVTLPLKQAAFTLCDDLTERARRAGAVNTLVRNGDTWHGDNTDGVGLVRDLTERHALDLRARRTLLIGAGGAARGVAPALLDAGIGDLFIVNRTPERTDQLADALAEPDRVHPRYLGDLQALGEFDLILNATSAARDGSHVPAMPRAIVGRRCAAVDLNYGEAAIPFLAWARAAGCHDVVDGLGMLVEQAAESFARWHGVRPETDAVYAMLNSNHDALVTAD